MNEEIKKPKDFLSRDEFLAALENNIESLADLSAANLATPRVIAVDSKWGNGKTWVAQELIRRLKEKDKNRPVVYLDVFRYDHHDDAFAVITASIFESLKPKGVLRKTFLSATVGVLKTSAPIAAKAAISLGAKAIGMEAGEITDAVVEATKESSAVFSEKAVEKLLKNYSETEKIQNHFIESLSKLTKDLTAPFVVIVDELDRCRPTFALEVLERIKHLFDAENIVFVLFWNAESIHESIRHTYGRGTNAEEYLSKFVAFSVPLTLSGNRGKKIGSRYINFIQSICENNLNGQVDSFDFRDSLQEVCAVLNPSLRQVKAAIQMTAHIKAQNSDWPPIAAYLVMLKAIDEKRFEKLCILDASTASLEAKNFEDAINPKLAISIEFLYYIFVFAADYKNYNKLVEEMSAGKYHINDLSELQIEVLRKTDSGKLLKTFLSIAPQIFQSLISPVK